MREKVLGIINKNMANAVIGYDQMAENLLELGMDSMEFIKVIVELEDAYKIEFPDEKLILSEMNTVDKIVEVLLELCSEKAENGD